MQRTEKDKDGANSKYQEEQYVDVLQADAIQCYIKKLEGHIAARHKVMSPSSEIKPPVDPSAPRRSRAATGERDMGADAALASQMHGAGHHRNGNGGGLGDTMRPNRSKKGTKGIFHNIYENCCSAVTYLFQQCTVHLMIYLHLLALAPLELFPVNMLTMVECVALFMNLHQVNVLSVINQDKPIAGDHSEAILSDGADSDDAGWLKEEDAINLPSDADLDAMPVGKALTALLQAQQRVILALGRVEEPWDVRLQYVVSS